MERSGYVFRGYTVGTAYLKIKMFIKLEWLTVFGNYKIAVYVMNT